MSPVKYSREIICYSKLHNIKGILQLPLEESLCFIAYERLWKSYNWKDTAYFFNKALLKYINLVTLLEKCELAWIKKKFVENKGWYKLYLNKYIYITEQAGKGKW